MDRPVSGRSSDKITGVDEAALEFLADHHFAGVNVAASKHGRLVLSKGYGFANTATSLAMQPVHRVAVGSTSKLATTEAVLQLVRRRLLALTTPLYTIHAGDWVARHGLTAEQYQDEFDRQASRGYRLALVSGYGEGTSTRYAAIWEHGPGPDQIVRHGLTSEQYQDQFDRQASHGYRLALVSGYGEGTSTRYAAIWEHGPGPDQIVRHGLTSEQYQDQFDRQASHGYRLALVSGYGEGTSTRYAAIWEHGPGPDQIVRHGLTSEQYQDQFDRQASHGYRLALVSGYGEGTSTRYAAIWEHGPGPDQIVRHGLTSEQYQDQLDECVGDGYRLVWAAGSGRGKGARYAGIWERDPRVVPGILRDRSFTDAIIEGAKRNVPESRVQEEVDKRLRWAREIQIVHLLSHTSGFLRSGDRRLTAQHFHKRIDDLTYVEAHLGVLLGVVDSAGPFRFRPGHDWSYSNHAFGLMGHIISVITGIPYDKYVQKNIFGPAGIKHAVPYGTPISDRDATRHQLEDGEPVPVPHQPRPTPDIAVATGGWAMAAQDFVRLLCAIDGHGQVPDVLSDSMVELMQTVPFPGIKPDQPLGWDRVHRRGASAAFAKSGKTAGGGSSYVRRFLPGYRATTGEDLSDVNVAVCANQSGDSSALEELSALVARRVGAADVPATYDLFDYR